MARQHNLQGSIKNEVEAKFSYRAFLDLDAGGRRDPIGLVEAEQIVQTWLRR